jgi:hypothetical protein
MDELKDFFSLVAKDPKQKQLQQVKENAKADLSSLFGQLAEVKKTDPKEKIIQAVRENVAKDITDMFAQLENTTVEAQHIEELVEQVEALEELAPLIEVAPVEVKTPEERNDGVEKYLSALPKDSHSYQDPIEQPVNKELTAITNKLKFLEQWVGKISAAGPGGGEVNLRWLDDVDRSTIYDMRYLRYNNTKKKFEFAEVNPHDVVYTTTLVETPTYTVNDEDYYVGVNYNGPTTITLPATPSSGRMIIIKDESGNAEINPITVEGTVDNDTGGFIIQINNGAIQLLYRHGWRIV